MIIGILGISFPFFWKFIPHLYEGKVRKFLWQFVHGEEHF